jgi:hypothetical protein
VNVELQIQRLESLLVKIQMNAAALAAERGASAAQIGASPLSIPVSSADLADDELVTMPPAARESVAPRQEMRSGLHSVLDPLPEEEPISAAPAAVAEREPEASEAATSSVQSSRPPDDRPSTILDVGEREPATRAPEYSEEVTGERPALSASGDDLHAVAVRTPPPESGPQVSMPPGLGYDSTPDLSFEESPVSARADGPTIEQLGSTVDLDTGSESLDLQVEPTSRKSSWPPGEEEELEAAIPSRRFAGTYDESLAPPPSAQSDLDAHDRAERERARRSSLPAAPELYSQPPQADAPADASHVGESWDRPPVRASVAAATYENRPRRSAKSFTQLLDAALSLRRP